MRLKVMFFASLLLIAGLTMFCYGTSMTNQVMNPESLISGTYLVVIGIFVGIAGFLMLLLQMFQRQSLAY
jgi:hypothetical protein